MIINYQTVQIAKINYLSIDELSYLYMLCIEDDWELNIFPASIAKLKRFNLLTDDNEVTPAGVSIVSQVLETAPTKTSINYEEEFEKFWLAFPRDDEHHTFSRSRAIRINKAVAFTAFVNTLNNEKVTATILVEAVEKEITYRKTFKQENYLKYMKSPANWLRDKVYLDDFSNEITEEEGYGKQVY